MTEEQRAMDLYRSGLSLRRVEEVSGFSKDRLRYLLRKRKELRGRLEFQGTPETRYESRINRQANGCWIFTGVINNMGYGMVSVRSKRMLAHRFFFEMKNGPIPVGMDACHKCDVPACVNPDHIFIGTRADNMRDASLKGRVRKGSLSPTSRFKEAEVLDMRERYAAGQTTGQIGKIYDTNYRTIWSIVTKKSWSHI